MIIKKQNIVVVVVVVAVVASPHSIGFDAQAALLPSKSLPYEGGF